jgi:hypothetical protein
MFTFVQDLFHWLSGRWCYVTHPAPMWPVNGRYRCPKCFRTYSVPWSGTECGPSAQGPIDRYARDRCSLGKIRGHQSISSFFSKKPSMT